MDATTPSPSDSPLKLPFSPAGAAASLEQDVRHLSHLIQEIQAVLREGAVMDRQMTDQLVMIGAGQTSLKETVDSLVHVVRDGNGQPSILSRLANLEAEHKQHRHAIKTVKRHYNSITTAKATSRGQTVAAMAQSAGMVGLVVIGTLVSVVVAYFSGTGK